MKKNERSISLLKVKGANHRVAKERNPIKAKKLEQKGFQFKIYMPIKDIVVFGASFSRTLARGECFRAAFFEKKNGQFGIIFADQPNHRYQISASEFVWHFKKLRGMGHVERLCGKRFPNYQDDGELGTSDVAGDPLPDAKGPSPFDSKLIPQPDISHSGLETRDPWIEGKIPEILSDQHGNPLPDIRDNAAPWNIFDYGS